MISFGSHSGIYTLETEQLLPVSMDKAWDFFSSPKNLCRMTPAHMKFEITSGKPGPMYEGQIISYRLSPFPGIKTSWVTEITVSDPPYYFVDEQRFGPYLMWHHEHRFEQYRDTVLMKDKVSYKLPLGILGRLAHFVLVKNQLRHIFKFRQESLNQLFSESLKSFSHSI